MNPPDPETVGRLAAKLDAAAQARLGRSLALFHAAGGGCGGCELELRMLRGLPARLQRLGLAFVDRPGAADVLLVTGPLTRTMIGPLRRTWDAVPEPKWLVALGACAVGGGPFAGSYALQGGIATALPVDLVIPGCPPSPAAVLEALAALVAANI